MAPDSCYSRPFTTHTRIDKLWLDTRTGAYSAFRLGRESQAWAYSAFGLGRESQAGTYSALGWGGRGGVEAPRLPWSLGFPKDVPGTQKTLDQTTQYKDPMMYFTSVLIAIKSNPL